MELPRQEVKSPEGLPVSTQEEIRQEEEAGQPPSRLLRLAKGMLVGLTVFFFIASLAQLFYLHQRIANTPELHLKELIGKN